MIKFIRYIDVKSLSKTYLTFFLMFMAVSFNSCHEAPDYKNDIYGNFDALVDIMDAHYCFFEDKDIDWRETAAAYRKLITPETSEPELFFICEALLDELKDGHINLSSRFNVSYYRNWWSDYPQDFNLRTLEEYYLKFNWLTTSGIYYYMLDNDVAYMYYPSFANQISETSLDYILAILHNSRGLIIDIRNNGGGTLTNINTLVGRFIDRKMTGGYILHKTGPGHTDFSEPYPVEYEPADPYYRVKYNGPVVVLTNRSCFSAANNFVSVMKEIPKVVIMGAKTGGGGGMPFSSELPNGWGIRFSACPILDAKRNIIENGIEPSSGFEVHASDEELAEGTDAILDAAIDYLKQMPLPDEEK